MVDPVRIHQNRNQPRFQISVYNKDKYSKLVKVVDVEDIFWYVLTFKHKNSYINRNYQINLSWIKKHQLQVSARNKYL